MAWKLWTWGSAVRPSGCDHSSTTTVCFSATGLPSGERGMDRQIAVRDIGGDLSPARRRVTSPHDEETSSCCSFSFLSSSQCIYSSSLFPVFHPFALSLIHFCEFLVGALCYPQLGAERVGSAWRGRYFRSGVY